MFYFFHSAQRPDNIRFHKGLLFEDLLRGYLESAGYHVHLGREKHNSLEYDIDGHHGVDRREVMGEAKAHEDTISGDTISSFVGRFVPRHFANRKATISGLFLSTSPLSPDANDYLRNVLSTTPFSIEAITGTELQGRIATSLRLPNVGQVRDILRERMPVVDGLHLLHTDLGTFLLAVGAGAGGVFPDRFALLRSASDVVNDREFLRLIRENIQALQELEPIASEVEQHGAAPPRREVPQGLATGASWVDYRQPASPTHFVGREVEFTRAEALLSCERGSILEVKARSGVGKSSFLGALAARWSHQGYRVELHDARDVHSAADVLSSVRRFLGASEPLRSFENASSALRRFAQGLGSGRAVFIVDQFESTFGASEVFRAYEYVAMCVARGAPGLSFVFARKDDLLTTHDDLQISLDRIRALAVSISLDDFSREEAADLLRRAAADLPKRASPMLLEQVLEFAEGFPWLLKRTMAHVDRLMRAGMSPQDIISSGLHPEDLFKEELSELDEVERGYLLRIVPALPATLHALARRFENDSQLPRMLDRLTTRRVLRFSAGTYDTYNDVFKDFLLYDRMPERRQAHLLKMGPPPVLRAFRALGGRKVIDVEALGSELGRPLGSTYNVLRELRVVGLVARGKSAWEVPDVVREYEHQGRLGEYLRQSLLKNQVVSDALILLEGEPSGISSQRWANFLTEYFPFIDARPDVWQGYAGRLLSWLEQLRFVTVSADGTITRVEGDSGKICEELGNVHPSSRGSRPREAVFVPSRDFSVFRRLLVRAGAGPVQRGELRRIDEGALAGLRAVGAVEVADGLVVARWSETQLVEFATTMFQTSPYKEFLGDVVAGETYADALRDRFGFAELADETAHDLGQKLFNWAKVGGAPNLRVPSKPVGDPQHTSLKAAASRRE